MSKYNVIGIDMGHPLGCGANGFVSETDKDRLIGKELIKILEAEGKKIVNCTIDAKYSDDLARRVNIANKAKVDLYVSIHLDSFSDPSANGVTIFTTTTSGAKEIAKRVVNNVASSCGYRNRGLKHENFYVIKNTIAPAFLIECGFVTNKDDCNRFNAYKIAKAIAEEIVGKKIQESDQKPSPAPGGSVSSYTVKVTADVLNVRAGAGTNYKVNTQVRKGEVYTIVGESNGWGKLKSGAGWISLKYTSKNGPSTPANKPTQTIKVGSSIKITGSKYATGQSIPAWVKANTYTVQQIKGDRALIKEITSWVYTKDLKLV